MASYKILKESVDDINNWRKGAEETIGELQIAGAVRENELGNQKEYVEKQLDLLRQADEKLIESLDAAKNEFSKGIMKVVLWVVGILLTVSGIGLKIYQMLSH